MISSLKISTKIVEKTVPRLTLWYNFLLNQKVVVYEIRMMYFSAEKTTVNEKETTNFGNQRRRYHRTGIAHTYQCYEYRW
jgi:hypothetical protein